MEIILYKKVHISENEIKHLTNNIKLSEKDKLKLAVNMAKQNTKIEELKFKKIKTKIKTEEEIAIEEEEINEMIKKYETV